MSTELKELESNERFDRKDSAMNIQDESEEEEENDEDLNNELSDTELADNKSTTRKESRLSTTEFSLTKSSPNHFEKKSHDRQTSGNKETDSKYANIRSIQTKKKLIYPLSAMKFTQFQADLFDAIGIKDKKEDQSNEMYHVKDLNQFINDKLSSALIENINNLKEVAFKQNLNKQERNKNSSKIITIILNQSIRPRRIGRLLLNKRNTTNLDAMLSEISNLFKMDYTSIKKLYSLNGKEVHDVTVFSSDMNVYLAFMNDKVHSKDFDLDFHELNLVFANELMKKSGFLNDIKIKQKNFSHKDHSDSATLEKMKLTSDDFNKANDNDLQSIPEELTNYYELGPIVGEGHYAFVRECRDINTGIQFALKIIDLRKCAGKENMIENELKILRKVKHPNIIKLVEEYRSKDSVYLIMEFLKGGDLLETLKDSIKYSEKDAAVMVHSLVSAVSYLHSLNIAHRDIKLENILIQKYSDRSICLKLGDFGLATFVDSPLNQKCGSPVYVAPEVLEDKSYGLEVDVWSLGVITYILLCGFAPFQGATDDETFELIKHEQLKFPNPYWDNISDEAKDLISKMMERNQQTRIKAEDILKHEWFSYVKSAEYKKKKSSSTLDFVVTQTKNEPSRPSTQKTKEHTSKSSVSDKSKSEKTFQSNNL